MHLRDGVPGALVCEQGLCVRDTAGAVDASGGDSDLPNGCSCSGNTLVCPSGETPCPTGCSTVGGAHCTSFVPSNGADPGSVTGLTLPITIDGNSTFNGDTGRINGAISRPQGEGVN